MAVQTQDVQAMVLSQEHGAKLSYYGASNMEDSTGYFDSTTRNDGASAVGLVQKRDPGGNVVGSWRVLPPAGFKADAIAITNGGPADTDVICELTDHNATLPDGTRDIQKLYAVIPGVFVPPAPRRGNVANIGQTTGDTIDYQRIHNDMVAVVVAVVPMIEARLIADLGIPAGHNLIGELRPHILQKVEEAIQAEGVLREGTVHDSPGLFNRIHETVYQTLQENGLVHRAQAKG